MELDKANKFQECSMFQCGAEKKLIAGAKFSSNSLK